MRTWFAVLLLSACSWAQGGRILLPIMLGAPAAAAPVPTLIQGPFMTPNDVASQSSIGGGAGAGFIQNCYKSTTQVGDTLIVEVITNSTTSNVSVTDDGSSSNTYAIPSGATETAGGAMHSFYVATVSHASRCVKVNYATGTGATNNQIVLWEYANLGAVDQTCAATVTSGTAPACSAMTTTVNGDLVVSAVAVVSFGTKPTGSMHFTAQASWALATNNGTDWTAAQTIIQSAAGSITPAITTSTAVSRANIIGIAFKAASAGGTMPTGPYVLSMQHQNNWGLSTAPTATSETLYFPCPTGYSGVSLWLMVGNLDSTNVTAVSDSTNGSWTGLTRVDSTGDGFEIQWYHKDSATCASTIAVTLTYGANPSGLIPLWDFFVVVGAASGYDSSATCGAGSTPCAINTTCNSTTTVGGATITPSGYPALVLSYNNQDFDTISAVNVGQFLAAVEDCPGTGAGCGGAGTGTDLAYAGPGFEQDAGIMADNLASGSAAISWTVANTQSQNAGPCFSSTVAVK